MNESSPERNSFYGSCVPNDLIQAFVVFLLQMSCIRRSTKFGMNRPSFLFLVWPLLPTNCKGSGLLLHLITLNDTQKHSLGLVWTTGRPVAETSIWQHRTRSQETDIHAPGGNRTPQSQQASGRRPTPYTARPLGSVGRKLRIWILRTRWDFCGCAYRLLLWCSYGEGWEGECRRRPGLQSPRGGNISACFK
jgi:hypothetical protein